MHLLQPKRKVQHKQFHLFGSILVQRAEFIPQTLTLVRITLSDSFRVPQVIQYK